jgi:single-stranded DNA-specific DHH superfamily exonuclease
VNSENKEMLTQLSKKLCDAYGEKHQIIKAIEEMAELSKELCKLVGSLELFSQGFDKSIVTKDFVADVLGELIDVCITLQQVEIILGVSQEHKNILIAHKIKRTAERLQEDINEQKRND